jgi:hypothetical protein
MSQQTKLEKVLELLINEDTESASELLHQIIVEKARLIYEEIAEEEEDGDNLKEEDEEEEGNDSKDLNEEEEDANEFGGDPDKDFTSEISSDKDEIATDELNDGEADDEENDGEHDEAGEHEGDVEDRVEDLETQLLALRAEFDRLMMDEVKEPYHQELGAKMGLDTETPGAEDEFNMESMMEETQFLKPVGDTGQKQEGKMTGTGKNTPKGAINTKSPVAHSKVVDLAEPVDFTKGKGDKYGQYHGENAKDDTIATNVKTKTKTVSNADKAGNKDDKLAGTGKNTPTGATNTKSVLRPVKS